MVFTWSSLTFIFFSIVFLGASAASSIFILPLLFLSFMFSGLVVIFSGLSYTTFKLASSKYNHTVLFLSKLLRKLADNIPPSVGFEEIQQAKETPLSFNIGFSFIPDLNLTKRFNSVYKMVTRPFGKNPTFANQQSPIDAAAKSDQDFQVEQIDSNTRVVIDEDEEEIGVIPEGEEEVGPLINSEETLEVVEEREVQPVIPNDDQPIKDSEVDSSDD